MGWDYKKIVSRRCCWCFVCRRIEFPRNGTLCNPTLAKYSRESNKTIAPALCCRSGASHLLSLTELSQAPIKIVSASINYRTVDWLAGHRTKLKATLGSRSKTNSHKTECLVCGCSNEWRAKYGSPFRVIEAS